MKNRTSRNAKYTKRILWILAACIAVSILAAAFWADRISFAWRNVDWNGPGNTALCAITQNQVLKTDSDYTAVASGISSHGAASGVEGALGEADRATRSFTAELISGIFTLQATKAPTDTLTLTLNSTLETGNTEIFVIVDGAVHSRLPANQAHTLTLEGVQGKTILVKVAAEEAQLYVTVTRK